MLFFITMIHIDDKVTLYYNDTYRLVFCITMIHIDNVIFITMIHIDKGILY